MTHADFVTAHMNRYVDYDGKYGAQCTDLMRLYCRDVLGVDGYTLPAVSYARQLFTNFVPNAKFIKISNTPTNVPKQGDLIVWGIYPFITGFAGHVAIFDSGDVNSLITFDQNWGPTGSACGFRKHSYRGVLGWLRFK